MVEIKHSTNSTKYTIYLELSLCREDSKLHLLELQEGMVQGLCGCKPLLRISHQQLAYLKHNMTHSIDIASRQ